jgi:hypothetical protein
MPSIRKVSKTKVQIDAQWLLGPSTPSAPTPRRHVFGSILAILTLFAGVGAVAYYWESWSHQVLRWQWERNLAAQETDLDTIAALVSLADCVDNATVLLIEQLQSTDPTRRSVAFQVLKGHCESEVFRKLDPIQQQTVVEALERLQPPDSDSIMMRGWIAARLMASLTPDHPTDIDLRQRLSPLLDRASNPNRGQTVANAPSLLLRGVSDPKPSEAMVSKPAIPPLPTSPLPLSPPPEIAPPPKIASPLAMPSLQAMPAADTESLPKKNNRIIPNELREEREPTRIRIANETKVRPITGPASISGAASISGQPTMSLSDRVDTTPEPQKISMLIKVRQERPVEDLLRALEEEPDQEVGQIIEELEANGFSESHVELAMALARGESQERQQALDALTGDPSINPIPWLVWMTESSDLPTKMKAIAMLGSTSDAEAVRYLRLIQQRESDPHIAAQIQQALLATSASRVKTR